MGELDQVINGTGVYIGLVLGLIVLTYLARCVGLVSKDFAEISTVLYSVAGVCTWTLWLCAWMHQWHPLIKVTYDNDAADEATSAPTILT